MNKLARATRPLSVVLLILALAACEARYDMPSPGPRGATGSGGAQGPQGIPGTSCSVALTDAGQIITCPDGESAIVPPSDPLQYICHIPPGNPSRQGNFYLPASAVAAHLAHGDHLGECQ